MRPIHTTLQPVVHIAKEKGYRVFTFESEYFPQVRQIFITDGKRIGTCQVECGDVVFSTIHKPTRGIGSGFRCCDFSSLEEGIEESMSFAPRWVSHRDISKICKYDSENEYMNKCDLRYYYI